MPDNVSPEERLFKVIKDGKSAPSDNPAAGAGGGGEKVKTKQPMKNFFSGLKPIKLRPAAAGARSSHAPMPRVAGPAFGVPLNLRTEDLKNLNRFLILILIVVTMLAAYYLFNKMPRVDEVIESVSGIPFERPEKRPIEAFKPIAFYVEEFNKRDILHPARPEKTEEELAQEEIVEEILPGLAATLKLQGISMGKVPKAMIQDSIDGQIYFVKRGQTIGGTGIKVKEITKDKVVISLGREEMNLL